MNRLHIIAGGIVLVLTISSRAYPAQALDNDHDGLIDAKEDSLLAAYAPVIALNRRDDRRPCDYEWYVERTTLEYDCFDNINNKCIAVADTTMRADIRNALTLLFTDPGSGAFIASDFWKYRRFPRIPVFVYTSDHTPYTDVYLALNSAYYNGQTLEEVLRRKNVGLYGHVAPAKLRGMPILAVQYYELFAYNDLDYGGPGNHQADWNEYELFLTWSGQPVAQIWYWHGNKTVHYVPTLTTPDELFALRAHKGDDVITAVSQLEQHAKLYVGYNDHEFFPSPGEANPLTTEADYIAYQTVDVPNVGEMDWPSTGYDVLLRYNGYWGTWYESDLPIPDNASPEGLMHNSGLNWQWPTLGSVHVSPRNGWGDIGAPYDHGSLGSPYSSIGAAVDSLRLFPASGGDPFGTHRRYLLLEAGGHRGSVKVDIPVVLGAWNGTARVGN